MKIYYAHCMAIYNTPQEERDIALLEKLGFEVLNPNLPEHQKGCEGQEAAGGTIMGYFIKLVLGCDALAFRALPSGELASGVAKEVKQAREMGMPIIELPNWYNRTVLSVDTTRQYFQDVGYR